MWGCTSPAQLCNFEVSEISGQQLWLRCDEWSLARNWFIAIGSHGHSSRFLVWFQFQYYNHSSSLSFFCMIRFMIRHNDNDLLVKYLQFGILLFAMFCAVPKPIDYENDVGCCIKCRLRCNWSGPHSAQWVRESQCWGRCWLYDVDLHACLCCKWYCTGLPLEVRIVPCVELGHDEGVGYNQNPVHILYEEAWPIRTKPYAFDLTHSVFIQSAIECLICTRWLDRECCAGEGMGHMRQASSRTGGSIGEIRVRCKNERSMTAWLHEFSECV